MYCGSWKVDDLLTFDCATHTASTGAATDADGAPAYRVYEDETTTPILTGTMALLDGSNTVGLYSEQITLSAANGFEKGKRYTIYISAAVAGVTGVTTRNFQMEAEVDVRHWVGSVPSALIAGRVDSSVGAVQNNVNGVIRTGTAQSVGANQIVFDSGAAFVDDALIGATVVITDGTQVGSRSIITDYVGATDTATLGNGWTGATPSGTPTFAIFASAAGGAPADSAGVTTLLSRIGTPSDLGGGATVAANLSDIEAQTDDIGSAGAGLTALATAAELAKVPKSDGTSTWNATALASLQQEATDALNAYDPPTQAELTSALAAADDAVLAAIAALNNLSSVQAQTAAAAALTAYDPPTEAEMNARTLAAASYATAAALTAVDTVVDSVLALLDDPRAEPGQGAPAVNADLATKIDYLYKWTRNKKTNDGSETKFFADDGTTVDHKQTVGESAGTVTKGEIATGP